MGTTAASAALQQCLKLLRGPSDENRFVGLLVATKLLPTGDAGTLRAILDAVGFSFIERLLLPLSRQAEPEGMGQAAVSQATAGCSLALAVLSSCASRLEDLAASAQLLALAPQLLLVVKSGGVFPAIATAGGASPEHGDEQMDADSVCDALECVGAMANYSGASVPRLAALGALTACARALQTGGRCQGLALAALAHLLGPKDGLDRTELFIAHPEDVCNAVVALAALANFTALSKAAETGRGASGGGAVTDEAKAQLEAVGVLLLVLPLPHGATSAAEALQARQREWAEGLRRGLHTLAVSRVGVVQRHAMLRLAAAVVELLGPGWLAGQGRDGTPTDSFFQATVEVVKVETAVLLHDLLAPAHKVLNTEDAMASSSDYVAPRHAPRDEDDDDDPMDEVTPDKPSGGESVKPEAESCDQARLLLPPCFSLLEAALAVLVGSVSGTSDGFGDVSDTVAARAMGSVGDAIETVVQYLEEASQADGYAEDPIALAAVRLLGCFATEAPGVHSERLALLLPSLFGVTGGVEGPAQGTRFLLPLLSACAESALKETHASEDDNEEPDDAERQARNRYLDACSTPEVAGPLSTFLATLLPGNPLQEAGTDTLSAVTDTCNILSSALARCGGRELLVMPELRAAVRGATSWCRPLYRQHEEQQVPWGPEEALAILSAGLLCATVMARVAENGLSGGWPAMDLEAASQTVLWACSTTQPLVHLSAGTRAHEDLTEDWERTTRAAAACARCFGLFATAARSNRWIRQLRDGPAQESSAGGLGALLQAIGP